MAEGHDALVAGGLVEHGGLRRRQRRALLHRHLLRLLPAVLPTDQITQLGIDAIEITGRFGADAHIDADMAIGARRGRRGVRSA